MNKEVPSTLDESLLALDKLLSKKDKQFIQDNDEKKFKTMSHHTIGRWIRNHWGLWNGSELKDFFIKETKLSHPDDMSGIILTSYWRKSHDKPLKIKEQIKYYQDFWTNNK